MGQVKFTVGPVCEHCGTPQYLFIPRPYDTKIVEELVESEWFNPVIDEILRQFVTVSPELKARIQAGEELWEHQRPPEIDKAIPFKHVLARTMIEKVVALQDGTVVHLLHVTLALHILQPVEALEELVLIVEQAYTWQNFADNFARIVLGE